MNPAKGIPMFIRSFVPEDGDLVVELWAECGLVRPHGLPRERLAGILRQSPHVFLIAISGGKVIGTVVGGIEDGRGWINHLAVVAKGEHTHCARALTYEAESRLRLAGCTRIRFQMRACERHILGVFETAGYMVDGLITLDKHLTVNGPSATPSHGNLIST